MLSASPTAFSPVTEIVELIRAGKTSGIDEFRSLLAREPDHLEAIGHLAWALAHAGDYEGSIELCRRHAELDPESLEMRWRIGDRFVNLGKLEDARAAYQAVLDIAPECPDALSGLRYVHYLQMKHASGWQIAKGQPVSKHQTDNKELGQAEFKANAIAPRALPARVFMESTTKCNFFCRTCEKGYDPYFGADLDDDIFEKVRVQIMPSVVSVDLTGFGETTMTKDFDRNLSAAQEAGAAVRFVTNASLLNYERIEKLTSHPVTVTISFDGATKQTFEEVRRGANYDLILEKLAMIKKLRDINLSRTYAHFAFNFVALRRNIEELPEVVRIAHCYGIERVVVADYGFSQTEFDVESLRFDPKRANDLLDQSAALAAELGIAFVRPPPYAEEVPALPTVSRWRRLLRVRRILPVPNRFPQRCSSPWTETAVRRDGEVQPCCVSTEYMGSIKNKSFAEVWNGWRYRLLRWRIHGPLPSLACRHCFIAWGINGGNAGNVMAQEGLLVKAFYWAEIRLHGFLKKHPKLLGWIRGEKKEPEPAPNFYHGRPIGNGNRPPAHRV